MKKLLLFFVFFISLNTLSGPKVFRTDEGMLYVENVKNNKKEGQYKIYYENGQIKEKGTYQNGEKEGPYTHYFKNGDRQEGTYKNGERGPYKYYFNDGSIEEGIYKNGQRIKLR